MISVSHAKVENVHHLEWCTKYRFKALKREEFFKACEASLRRAAARYGIEVLELGVMSDHVHVVAVLPPDVSVSRAVGLLKGSSAYALFRLEPKFRLRYRKGHFWSRGYFARSVSNATLDVVRAYVRYDNDPRQQTLA